MDVADVQVIDAQYQQMEKQVVRFSDDMIEESPGRSVAKEQIVGSKSTESLHLLVLQDEGRRRKVETLRDAILEQQIELWASDYGDCLVETTIIKSMSSNSTMRERSFSKRLALLSWRHSWDDVKFALEAATTLEASLS